MLMSTAVCGPSAVYYQNACVYYRMLESESRNAIGIPKFSHWKKEKITVRHDPTMKTGATNAQMGHHPGSPVFTTASSKRPISLRRSMRGTLTSFPAAVHRVEPDLRAALQVLLSGRELMVLLRR